jgi:oligopeptide/dipeptide ABC transporter ATP-binding protein
MNGEPLLAVSDLITMFATPRGLVLAANGVSFEVNAGETVGLVGESGSGKSVTCRSILRLVPDPGEVVGGSIRFAGRDLLGLSKREMRHLRGRDISMIFQDPMSSLNPVFTIGDQIAQPLRLHRNLGRRAARAEAIRLLDRVGIPGARQRVNAYPHEFSGGMRQRVMIAIAISCKPRLLLADEPTTALDVTIQDQILSLLLGLQKEEGMAILLVSHDLGVIAQTCDRVAVMYAGFVVEQADVRELFSQPRHPYTAALLRALPEAAVGRGRLESIRGAPPDLGDLEPGCPFAPRCEYQRAACREVPMTLAPIAGRPQQTACPFNEEIGRR